MGIFLSIFGVVLIYCVFFVLSDWLNILALNKKHEKQDAEMKAYAAKIEHSKQVEIDRQERERLRDEKAARDGRNKFQAVFDTGYIYITSNKECAEILSMHRENLRKHQGSILSKVSEPYNADGFNPVSIAAQNGYASPALTYDLQGHHYAFICISDGFYTDDPGKIIPIYNLIVSAYFTGLSGVSPKNMLENRKGWERYGLEQPMCWVLRSGDAKMVLTVMSILNDMYGIK